MLVAVMLYDKNKSSSIYDWKSVPLQLIALVMGSVGVAHTEFDVWDLGPLLIPFLEPESRLQVRAACREGRATTDRAISTLSASRREQSAARQPAAQFIAFVRSLLSRGARPDKLILHPDFPGADGVEPEVDVNTAAALKTLEVFTQQQQALQQHQHNAPAPQFLRHISLCNIRYTDALASAVRSAAPHLASLDIASNLSYADRLGAATPGLCCLVATCAPSLTSLTFSSSLPSVPQPLADAVATCTRLQHLRVCVFSYDEHPDGVTSARDSVFRVATVAAALSSLRSLSSKFICMDEDGALEESLEPIRDATQLTSLDIDSPVSTTHLLKHVLRPMRSSLVRLSLHGYSLYESDLRLLAAEYGQLTYFEFENTGCDPLDLNLVDRERDSVPLPAALRELHLPDLAIVPWELLALHLPSGLTRLSIYGLLCFALAVEDHNAAADADDQEEEEEEEGGLVAGLDVQGALDGKGTGDGGISGSGSGSDSDIDEQPGDGGAGEDAGAGMGDGALLAALPSPCPGFDELLEAVALLHGRLDGSKGLALRHEWEPSPLTWPAAGDGHVRLFAALRPLGLRRLELYDCVLELGDVAALVEQLPQLQELSLRCQLHPAVVPLLARLPRLRELHLTLTRGHGTDTWSSSGTAVAAALLPLVLGAPRVQRLQLAAHRDSGHKLLAALREGVEWVQGQLRGMGRDPAVVSVLISNFVG